MCKKATCATCGKTTWWGCGQHIDSVMNDVPEDQKCKCEKHNPKMCTTM